VVLFSPLLTGITSTRHNVFIRFVLIVSSFRVPIPRPRPRLS
jgi:hypothetical protein